MGKNAVRLGDKTTHGGQVITASSSTMIEGKLVALLGDIVSCPREGHGNNKIISGANTCFSDGKPIVLDNAYCECGCRVIASIRNAEME